MEHHCDVLSANVVKKVYSVGSWPKFHPQQRKLGLDEVCKLFFAEESVQVTPQKLHDFRLLIWVVQWLKTLVVA